MPVFVAYFKAELEGVSFVGIHTNKDAMFTIDVKNGMSDETRERVTISPSDEFELEGSRGVSNLVLKFADSNEKSSCSVLTPEDFKSKFKKKKEALKSLPRALTGEDNGEWVPIVAFEARGMDVTKLHLTVDDLVVHSEGDTIFNEGVDLSEGDWADYDAEADMSVSITNAVTKVELVR